MTRHTLHRIGESDDGTLGTLLGLATMEEEANDPLGYPRIPAGTYVCQRSRFYRGGYETFEVTGVPGRSRILFHRGNTENDTAGCILIGTRHDYIRVRCEETGIVRRKAAVVESARGFRLFMEHLTGVDEWELHITDYAVPEPEVEMVDSGIHERRRAA